MTNNIYFNKWESSYILSRGARERKRETDAGEPGTGGGESPADRGNRVADVSRAWLRRRRRRRDHERRRSHARRFLRAFPIEGRSRRRGDDACAGAQRREAKALHQAERSRVRLLIGATL